MYLEDACTIKLTDDGKFVLSVSPPKKKVKAGEENMVHEAEEPKTYVANDMDELIELLQEYLPQKKSEKDKYKKGFMSK